MRPDGGEPLPRAEHPHPHGLRDLGQEAGAELVSIDTTASSLVKGETLRDTAEDIRAMGVDAIVMRHSSAGSARYLGSVLDISVVNAGDGAHEHPDAGPARRLHAPPALRQGHDRAQGHRSSATSSSAASPAPTSSAFRSSARRSPSPAPPTLVPAALKEAFPQVRHRP
jgi:hypothetical protein